MDVEWTNWNDQWENWGPVECNDSWATDMQCVGGLQVCYCPTGATFIASERKTKNNKKSSAGERHAGAGFLRLNGSFTSPPGGSFTSLPGRDGSVDFGKGCYLAGTLDHQANLA